MFNRRLVIFLVAVGLAMAIGLARLAQLQLVKGAAYADEAARQMIRAYDLDTHRGDILDRQGRILATDQACYEFRLRYRALLLDWAARRTATLMDETGLPLEQAWAQTEADLAAAKERSLLTRWIRRTGRKREISADAARLLLTERVGRTLDRAAALANVPREHVDANVDAIVRRVQRIRRSVGLLVAEETRRHAVLRALDEPTAVDLRTELDWMVDGQVGPSTRRWYPYGDLACHVIGRLGRVSREVMDNDPNADDPLLEYRPDELVGVAGVERMCEQHLRGVRGSMVRRRSGEALDQKPPSEGESVRLTLDIELQRRATDLLAARSHNGAAVVIDVASGEILALVSTPTYDLNTWRSEYQRLASDSENLPLLNRAIGRAYPPGSTVKPITALAGLAEKVINVSTVFECRGHADPRRPRCWNRRGHGRLALSDAIMNSCNAWFSRAAERLGPERLIGWMRRFGLGERPGTGLPGEAAGLAPTRQWLMKNRGRTFYPGDARQMAVGQGLLEATPLQIANAMAAIARDGEFRSPVLVADDASPVRRTLDLPPGAIAAVREGMYRVANDRQSQTAYRYLKRTDVVLCGKTGTAQVRGRTDIAWFCGFAPRRKPRVAFAVVQDFAGGGGANCAKLAESIVTACKDLGYLDEAPGE